MALPLMPLTLSVAVERLTPAKVWVPLSPDVQTVKAPVTAKTNRSRAVYTARSRLLPVSNVGLVYLRA
jgi:hypothetical protein